MALGAAVFVPGALLYLSGRSDAAATEKWCPGDRCSTPAWSDLASHARSNELAGALMMAGGVATAAAGAVLWHWFGRPAGSNAKGAGLSTVTPWAGAAALGLDLNGRF